jgi:sodium pump decarboxylase gamma subunit
MLAGATTLHLLAAESTDTMQRAVEIASIGMLMVFAALVLLCVFLALLPRVLARIAVVWPEAGDHHAAPAVAAVSPDEEDEVLAAIGYVLHAEPRESP